MIEIYENGTKYNATVYFRDYIMKATEIPNPKKPDKTVLPPIRFGVSILSRQAEMSLRITSQNRPLNS